ncbi:hypothetical protein OAS_16740 [Vibrio cyclitrophicus ZF65]|nr:hypothetical protein OAS_16740 [Vibrio cyclitrophicus ZF65]
MKKNVILCLAEYRNHLRNKALVAVQHKKPTTCIAGLQKVVNVFLDETISILLLVRVSNQINNPTCKP